MNDEVLDRLSRLVKGVQDCHGLGRLSLPALAAGPSGGSASGSEESDSDGPAGEAVAEVVCFGAAMTCLVPARFQKRLPFDLPREIRSARLALAALGVDDDPRQIDLHQIGVQICGIFEVSPEDYRRSVRAKRQVPPSARRIIERCFGLDGRSGYRDVAELQQELSSLDAAADSTVVRAPDLSPTPNPVASSPQDLAAAESTATGGPSGSTRLSRIGTFELEQLIGQGGMGDVYRGYDRALRRPVAVKVLPDELARKPGTLERFQAEASAIALLNHPHVIPIYHVGEDAGRHFFVMPFVDGESLAERLSRCGRVPIGEAVKILLDVLAGLQAAHEQGLVHRDVKPGNVLLHRETGRAVVADFGLVKSLTGSVSRTATGLVIGTVDYMSPEQGRGAGVDLRSDLYSAGVMLYQLLAGRLPFSADSPTAMIFQHVYERPVPLIGVVSDVPYPLWMIVARLLAKRPAARYQSARAVSDDLEAFLAGRGLAVGGDWLDVESLWRPATASGQNAAETLLIRAPSELAADQLLLPPVEAADPPAPGGWRKILSFRRGKGRRTPGRMSVTQRQVEEAVAEHEARRDQVSSLVREAEEVLAELRIHEGGLEGGSGARLVAEQEEQLATMRLQLARIEANLQTLDHQRHLLNARLAVSRARAGEEGPAESWRLIMTAGGIVIAAALVIRVVFRPPHQSRPTLLDAATASRLTPAGVPLPPRAVPPVSGPRTPPKLNGPPPQFAMDSRKGTAVVASALPTASGQAGIRAPRILVSDLRRRRPAFELPGPHISHSLTLSRGGDLVASAGMNAATRQYDLRVWSLLSRELVGRYPIESPRRSSSLAFSRDGKTLFVVASAVDSVDRTQTPTIKAIDLATQEVSELPREFSLSSPYSVAASPTRDWLLIGVSGTRSAADLFDLHSRTFRWSLPVPAAELVISDDGTTAAVASLAFSVSLFDMATQRPLATFDLDRTVIDRLRLSLDGKRLAWGSGGRIHYGSWKRGGENAAAATATGPEPHVPAKEFVPETTAAFEFDQESNLWAVGLDGVPVPLDGLEW